MGGDVEHAAVVNGGPVVEKAILVCWEQFDFVSSRGCLIESSGAGSLGDEGNSFAGLIGELSVEIDGDASVRRLSVMSSLAIWSAARTVEKTSKP
ncbi:hypothetical protein MA16_Dca006874 [Dendrobium catenatum]|uniref:Uncharacterized protein n=1 Tax=Dendrobium catenatum TaxID=906689 RepID=A0A2I0VT08_9ASPA|nr:hypothetical protein MA16_Dca006874 [Dendrobium catenatum]